MGVLLYKYTLSQGKEKRVVLVARKNNCLKLGAFGAILGHSCARERVKRSLARDLILASPRPPNRKLAMLSR